MEQLADPALERALAGEAVFAHERYSAHALSPEEFAGEDCRVLVAAAAEAWELGDAGLDGTIRALQRKGQLARFAGGRQGVMALLASGGAVDPARLRLLGRLRAIQQAAADAIRVAGQEDLAGALERLQGAFSAGIANTGVEIKDGLQLAEVAVEGIRNRETYERRNVYPGVAAIEELVGYLPLGSVTVVGADTGVGKSSLALEMIIGASERNVVCGLISVEDPHDVTGARLLGAYSGINSGAIQRGRVAEHAVSELVHGVGKLRAAGKRQLFADCVGATDLEVRAAMTLMAQRGARLIVVDYLQEIDSSTKEQDRRNEVRKVAKALKAHAKRCQVALVLISQIARPDSKNPNSEPTKHHLKESGDVTNSAEVILLMWRTAEADDATIRVKVAKSKWGGLGRFFEMVRGRSGRLELSV